MSNKNRFVLPVLVFIVVTIVWYFILDARAQVSANLCELVDCFPPEGQPWRLLYGSTCCGSLTTFRVFVSQLLQLLVPGAVLAGGVSLVLNREK